MELRWVSQRCGIDGRENCTTMVCQINVASSVSLSKTDTDYHFGALPKAGGIVMTTLKTFA